MEENKELEIIHITKSEYDRLVKRDTKLTALESAGVDNWDGWDEAMKILDEWEKEDAE